MATTLFDTATLLYVPGASKAGKSYFLKPVGADKAFSVVRAGETSRFGPNNTIEEGLPNNYPCVDFGGLFTSECPSLVVDIERTNRLEKSNDVQYAPLTWLGIGLTPVGTKVAPNGLNEAVIQEYSGASTDHIRQSFSSSAGQELEIVFYASLGSSEEPTREVRVQYFDGSSVNLLEVVEIKSHYWKEFRASFTATGAANQYIRISNSITAHDGLISYWGVRVTEPKSYLHIPTDDAIVTRPADQVQYTQLQSGILTPTQGSLYLKVKHSLNPENNASWQITDGTDRIGIFGAAIEVVSGGGTVTQQTGNILPDSGDGTFDGQIALAWDATSMSIAVNNEIVASGITAVNGALSTFKFQGFESPTFVRLAAMWSSKLTTEQLTKINPTE